MKRDLKKLEQEGIALQDKNSKVSLSISELTAIYTDFMDEAENNNAGLVDLIFKCFSIGAAAGARYERKRQSKRRISATVDR